MKRRIVKKFAAPAAMAAYAAGIFAKALAAKERAGFLAALPGGRTPAPLFKKLSRLPLPWHRVSFFMADERRVPLSSPESNFGAARARLFSRIKIPRANLHPVKPGPGAAAAYGRELLKETGGSGRLDLVVLGLGADGHIASLFPGGAQPRAGKSPVLAALAPRGAKTRRRVTLALKTINKASTVILMAAGPAKKSVFERARQRDKKIPAGSLAPRGELYLLFSETDKF